MVDENEKGKEKSFYESESYFNLDNATTDVQLASGAQETAAAIVKLAGKSLFNAGLIAGKTSFFLGKEIIDSAPDFIARIAEQNIKENSNRMSYEQISKATEYIEKNKGEKFFTPSGKGK